MHCPPLSLISLILETSHWTREKLTFNTKILKPSRTKSFFMNLRLKG